ncbi:Integrase [Ceratocystis lukuohia]
MSDGRATTRMGSSLTRDERIKAIQEIIDILDSHKVMDDCACDMLFDVFGEWTADEWRDLGGMYSRLRTELIRHGVYVPHHRITGSMMNSIEVASHPVDEWTDEMMKQYDTISLVYTGQSALQERLTKEKIPRDLWTVRQWILEDKTQGARPTQERAVRVAQPKQGKVTKGTQDAREEYQQGSATMVEGSATDRSMEGMAAVLEQELCLGVEQELGLGAGQELCLGVEQELGLGVEQDLGLCVEQGKTGGTDFADFKHHIPSSRNNAHEIEQRRIISLPEKAWPEEDQYSGTTDTVSPWLRFQSFVNKCNQLGLEEHYLHDALTCMMAAGNVRDYYAELVLTTVATDWKSVMIQMEQRFENEGMKLACDNRWLHCTLDEFIRNRGDGRLMHEIVFANYEWLESGQRSLSSVYHGHRILRDRLLVNLRQDHATARESSLYGYSNMTALDMATHVCNALKAELQVTSSVMATELYTLVCGFDVAACLKATCDEIYKRTIIGAWVSTVDLSASDRPETTSRDFSIALAVPACLTSSKNRALNSLVWGGADSLVTISNTPFLQQAIHFCTDVQVPLSSSPGIPAIQISPPVTVVIAVSVFVFASSSGSVFASAFAFASVFAFAFAFASASGSVFAFVSASGSVFVFASASVSVFVFASASVSGSVFAFAFASASPWQLWCCLNLHVEDAQLD